MTDRAHNFQMIDPDGDPALMCTECLVCKCCEPVAAEAPCNGEPEWLDDDETVERP